MRWPWSKEPDAHVEPTKTIRIHVKAGNLGTLHGWSKKIPVRIVKRVQIPINDGKAVG